MFEEYPTFLTVAECCEILGVGNHTIYNLINEGKLKAHRAGEKIWRINKRSLAKFILQMSGLDVREEDIDYYV